MYTVLIIEHTCCICVVLKEGRLFLVALNVYHSYVNIPF
jgi:hypothetical protein